MTDLLFAPLLRAAKDALRDLPDPDDNCPDWLACGLGAVGLGFFLGVLLDAALKLIK